jgi:hypothetical protein
MVLPKPAVILRFFLLRSTVCCSARRTFGSLCGSRSKVFGMPNNQGRPWGVGTAVIRSSRCAMMRGMLGLPNAESLRRFEGRIDCRQTLLTAMALR